MGPMPTPKKTPAKTSTPMPSLAPSQAGLALTRGLLAGLVNSPEGSEALVDAITRCLLGDTSRLREMADHHRAQLKAMTDSMQELDFDG